MIGDDPYTDIADVNAFRNQHNIEWRSILVETGSYVADTSPAHLPNAIVEDVKEAVERVVDWVVGARDIEAS
jgi:ribonucleotide monophosphatase NagD (HAD superfamily)